MKMQYSDVFGSASLDLTLAACLVSIVLIVWTYTIRRKNFPPGPVPLPIIGHIPWVSSDPHLELTRLGQKYGDIYSLGNVFKKEIVLNSGNAAREILSKPELLDRPDQTRFLLIPSKDPFFGNGLAWREHKKFALKVFRDLNEGKALEERIKVEIKRFMGILQKIDGNPFDCRVSLYSSIIDVMTMINLGNSFDRNSPDKKKIDEIIIELSDMVEKSMIFILFPWMAKVTLIKKILKFDKLLQVYHEAIEFATVLYKKQKEVLEEEKTRSLITSYIDAMANPSSDKSTFSEKSMVYGLMALFAAGTETTRDSLVWALYTMAVYPDVQTKVQREIDEAVGTDRMPSYSDQKEMKYTQAVLMEMLRWKTIVPVGIRVVTANTTFRTYQVPKDTIVLINIYGIHHDPKCWEDPDDFKPERFLSADGKHILKNDNFMPFSYGKRGCVGEGIALMETFMYFTNILQKFRVKLPDGDKPNFEGFGAISYQMKYHRLCFMPRDT